eukprot:6472624-Amphidinium_carterae.1
MHLNLPFKRHCLVQWVEGGIGDHMEADLSWCEVGVLESLRPSRAPWKACWIVRLAMLMWELKCGVSALSELIRAKSARFFVSLELAGTDRSHMSSQIELPENEPLLARSPGAMLVNVASTKTVCSASVRSEALGASSLYGCCGCCLIHLRVCSEVHGAQLELHQFQVNDKASVQGQQYLGGPRPLMRLRACSKLSATQQARMKCDVAFHESLRMKANVAPRMRTSLCSLFHGEMCTATCRL